MMFRRSWFGSGVSIDRVSRKLLSIMVVGESVRRVTTTGLIIRERRLVFCDAIRLFCRELFSGWIWMVMMVTMGIDWRSH